MDIAWIVFWVWLVGFFAAAFVYVRFGPLGGIHSIPSDTAGEKLLDIAMVGLLVILMSSIWPLILAGYGLYKLATIGMKKD